MQIDESDINALISKNAFLHTLQQETLDQLIAQMSKVTLEPGEILFKQGDSSENIYFVISGEVISYLENSKGKEIIGHVEIGDCVGELGALSGEPRSLTVKANTAVSLLCLPSSIFRDYCNSYPEILAGVTRLIISRSVQVFQRMSNKVTSISLVIPLNTHLKENFLVELKSLLQAKKNVAVYDTTTIADFIKKATKYQKEQIYNRIIFFLDSWNGAFVKETLNFITTIYVIFSEAERHIPSDIIAEINKIKKDLVNLRLELILLHQGGRKVANTSKWTELCDFNVHHHIHVEKKDDLKRVVRFMIGKAFALVLGGGGAKGMAHLGVFLALSEKGIIIDAIGGTSAGAVVAGIFANTQNFKLTSDQLEKTALAGIASVSWLRLTWPYISIFSGNPITKLLMQLYQDIMIEDMLIPYFAVSTDLTEGKEVIHDQGFLWQAMRATGSLPGLFPPVVKDGRMLCDGGLLNNLPVDVMRRKIGNDHTIMAVSLTFAGKPKDNRFPPIIPLSESLWRNVRAKYRIPPFFPTFLDALLLGSSVKEILNADSADILVQPDLSSFYRYGLTPKQKENLINKGYWKTLAELKESK